MKFNVKNMELEDNDLSIREKVYKYLRSSSGAGLNLELVPVVQEYSSIDDRLPTPVPGRPGLRIST